MLKSTTFVAKVSGYRRHHLPEHVGCMLLGEANQGTPKETLPDQPRHVYGLHSFGRDARGDREPSRFASHRAMTGARAVNTLSWSQIISEVGGIQQKLTTKESKEGNSGKYLDEQQILALLTLTQIGLENVIGIVPRPVTIQRRSGPPMVVGSDSDRRKLKAGTLTVPWSGGLREGRNYVWKELVDRRYWVGAANWRNRHWGTWIFDRREKVLVLSDTLEDGRQRRFEVFVYAFREMMAEYGFPYSFSAMAPGIHGQGTDWACGYLSWVMIHNVVRGWAGTPLHKISDCEMAYLDNTSGEASVLPDTMRQMFNPACSIHLFDYTFGKEVFKKSNARDIIAYITSFHTKHQGMASICSSNEKGEVLKEDWIEAGNRARTATNIYSSIGGVHLLRDETLGADIGKDRHFPILLDPEHSYDQGLLPISSMVKSLSVLPYQFPDNPPPAPPTQPPLTSSGSGPLGSPPTQPWPAVPPPSLTPSSSAPALGTPPARPRPSSMPVPITSGIDPQTAPPRPPPQPAPRPAPQPAARALPSSIRPSSGSLIRPPIALASPVPARISASPTRSRSGSASRPPILGASSPPISPLVISTKRRAASNSTVTSVDTLSTHLSGTGLHTHQEGSYTEPASTAEEVIIGAEKVRIKRGTEGLQGARRALHKSMTESESYRLAFKSGLVDFEMQHPDTTLNPQTNTWISILPPGMVALSSWDEDLNPSVKDIKGSK